ncbi:TPA: hypothetical protein ACH3X1_009223 [Trebouxia sp. C0004]
MSLGFVWHMATTYWLLGTRQCMPCDGIASPYICLIVLPSAELFDILVLPNLSCSCEVWAVNPKVGGKAELVHRQFLKQYLGVRKSTTNPIVFAEFGRFPI